MIEAGSSSVSIVIVNWNSGVQLKNCIESIFDAAPNFLDRIVIVDNGSVDGSDNFADGREGVVLIRAGENLGFGRACNLGAEHLTSEFILFLNPDAAVYSSTLQSAFSFMNRDESSNIGICGIQLIDEYRRVTRSCARFPTAMRFFYRAVALDKLSPRLGHYMADWPHDNNRKVDQVMGAFFFVRREIFEKLNGFDERFFVYFEEVDFSLRANQIGWHSFFLADAQAFHAGGGTSNQVKAKRLFYSLRSRLLYAAKHFSILGTIGVFLVTLFVEPISRSVLAVARLSWSSLKETWSGYGMLWRWLPQWIFKGVTR